MHAIKAIIIAKFLTCVCVARGHLPGQEFQYLSMFMKPEGAQGFSQSQLRRLTRQYARESEANRVFKLPSRKLLFEGQFELGNEDNLKRSNRRHWRRLKSSKEEGEGDGWDSEDDSGQTRHEEEGENKSNDGREESTDDDGESSGNGEEASSNGREEGDEEENDTSGNGKEDKVSIPQAVRVQTEKSSNSNVSLSKATQSGGGGEGDAGETGMSLAKRNGENIQRLSMMLMKIIKQYDVNSLVDVPCRAHAHWMPVFLEHLAERMEDDELFKYVCVDTSKAVLKELKRRVPVSVAAKFLVRRFWEEELPEGELVFSWSGLDNMKQKNVLKYVQKLAASKGKHGLVVLGSHSGELAKKGSSEKIARFTFGGMPINFRKEPFLLAKPMRIVSEVSTEGNDKQMYIYKPMKMMRDR